MKFTNSFLGNHSNKKLYLLASLFDISISAVGKIAKAGHKITFGFETCQSYDWFQNMKNVDIFRINRMCVYISTLLFSSGHLIPTEVVNILANFYLKRSGRICYQNKRS